MLLTKSTQDCGPALSTAALVPLLVLCVPTVKEASLSSMFIFLSSSESLKQLSPSDGNVTGRPTELMEVYSQGSVAGAAA